MEDDKIAARTLLNEKKCSCTTHPSKVTKTIQPHPYRTTCAARAGVGHTVLHISRRQDSIHKKRLGASMNSQIWGVLLKQLVSKNLGKAFGLVFDIRPWPLQLFCARFRCFEGIFAVNTTNLWSTSSTCRVRGEKKVRVIFGASGRKKGLSPPYSFGTIFYWKCFIMCFLIILCIHLFHFTFLISPSYYFFGCWVRLLRVACGGWVWVRLLSRSGSPQDQDLRWENGAHGIHVDGDMPRHRILNRWVAGIIRI